MRIDPGSNGAAALIRDDGGSKYGYDIVWAAPLFGAPKKWISRAMEIADRARDDGALIAVIEEPPKTIRTRSLRGDSRGHRSLYGLGRWSGRIDALLTERDISVVYHPVDEWTATFRGLSPKKRGDGSHRVREAEVFFPGGGRCWLEGHDPRQVAGLGRCIAAAEAALCATSWLIEAGEAWRVRGGGDG